MKLCDILAEKREFRVAFIGGSLTQGAGASKRDNRYTSRVTAYLNKRYPNTEFTEINAGIGGTPSAFGLFRFKADVLDKKPDMLFVEFAVNDGGNTSMYKYVEGILRAARRYDPKLPIVLLEAYSDELWCDATREKMHPTVVEHTRIAEAYGAPVVYMGKALYEMIQGYGGDKTFFLTDAVHPNDDGYKVYADAVMTAIDGMDFGFDVPQKPVTGTELCPVMSLFGEDNVPEGWRLSHRTVGNGYKYLHTDEAGARLCFEFEGTACGLYTRIEKDGGRATAVIDGKDTYNISFWDSYALSFDRDAFSLVADGLEFGKHTVEITVSADNDPKSEGHVARIVAFLAG
ncbi:MAG: hypothetical protein J6L92_06000 [Clostridia bacterium]|nr:hypothetical protein [Clostridia bacterium]